MGVGISWGMTNKNDGYQPPHTQQFTKIRGMINGIFFAFYMEYTVMGRDIQTYILLPNREACQIFIRDNEDMAEYMFADGDVNMWCLETGVMSKSIRPVLRPQVQSEAYH